MVRALIKKIFVILLVLVVGGLGGIIADRYLFPYLSTTKIFSHYNFLKRSTENVTVINRTEQVVVQENTSISKITDQATSSVVNILSYGNSSGSSAAAKNGTGVIVTSDGLIMTYITAINPTSSKFRVMTFDGNGFDAHLLGVDSYSNLAFFKIDTSNLPTASFADSQGAHPGDKVIAIGNSGSNYEARYATGLLATDNKTYNLSGKTVSSSEKLEGVFNTDFITAKNFVGGPVIDYSSHIIGIVGSLERDNQTDYFEIPSNKVKEVINKALNNNLDKNPVLGVYYLPISKTVVTTNSLSVDKGALIFSPSGQQGLAIIAGSPAQKAGLRINDVIRAVNGQEIDLSRPLSDILYQFNAGDKIELTVIRDGQEMKIPIQL